MKGGPIQFLVIVAALWGVARSTIVWTTPADAERDIRALLTWAESPARANMVAPPSPTPVGQPVRRPSHRLVSVGNETPEPAASKTNYATGFAQTAARSDIGDLPTRAQAEPAPRPFVPLIPPPALPMLNRMSVSSWAIIRGAGASALASGGQLGGSQAGLRASLRVSPQLAVAGRLSSPLRSRGAEAALGVDWRPVRTIPVTLTAERRLRIDGSGRNAFAVGLFGGVDNIPLPADFRLDGYAQAGVVGARRRDGYIDGAVGVDRPVAELGTAKVAVGGGVWGAAQPGVSRLDVGPQLVARVPAGATTLRFGLDWRQRVSGHARPGSGPSLSVGADF